MKRFTKKEPAFLGGYNISQEIIDTNNVSPLIAKLGIIEDLEQELGIDLITLFKALKEGAWFVDNRNNNIFYAKATLVSKIDGKFECPQEDLKFNGFIILDQLYGIGHELKDYGITWSLKKEDLEK